LSKLELRMSIKKTVVMNFQYFWIAGCTTFVETCVAFSSFLTEHNIFHQRLWKKVEYCKSLYVNSTKRAKMFWSINCYYKIVFGEHFKSVRFFVFELQLILLFWKVLEIFFPQSSIPTRPNLLPAETIHEVIKILKRF